LTPKLTTTEASVYNHIEKTSYNYPRQQLPTWKKAVYNYNYNQTKSKPQPKPETNPKNKQKKWLCTQDNPTTTKEKELNLANLS
jgi:hypothetical protein